MQIFMDMAVLVDAQGDMLDNIESQVKEIFSGNANANANALHNVLIENCY